MQKNLTLGLTLCGVILLAGCGNPKPPHPEGPIGMPNPASVFCVEQGGNSTIQRHPDGGEYGVCVFADGTSIDERELYRNAQSSGNNTTGSQNNDHLGSGTTLNMPNPASAFCEEQGGKVITKKDTEENEYGVCLLPSGEEVDEREYFRGATYVGLSVADAETLAKEKNVPFRVVYEDGKAIPATTDLREGRINATVNSGIVTSVSIE